MKTMNLTLDDTDYDAIQKAMAIRQAFRCMPDGTGDLPSQVIAEICRGWVEFLDLPDFPSQAIGF